MSRSARSPNPQSAPGSALRGRYLVRNAVGNRLLAGVDALINLLGAAHVPGAIPPPRRLLLAVGGHLGDAVIATSTLPLLRRALPDVNIGMLVPAWSRVVVSGHRELRWLHTVEPWKPNRSPDLGAVKWVRAVRGWRSALSEVRGVRYDVAIDLYPYFPNSIPLLRAAGIPVRVGYASGGFGGWLTHAVEWSDRAQHVADYHRALVGGVIGEIAGFGVDLRYDLPEVPCEERQAAAQRLRTAGVTPGEHVVLHMGAGSELKAWPFERWRTLAAELVASGRRVVLTGAGDEEARQCEQLRRSVPDAVDLCDQLGWGCFRAVVESAALVVSLDSVASHLAAAADVPCVSIMTGMPNPAHWRPLSARARLVTHAVPCAPCYQSRGCAAMSCIREVTVGEVLGAVAELQPPRSIPTTVLG